MSMSTRSIPSSVSMESVGSPTGIRQRFSLHSTIEHRPTMCSSPPIQRMERHGCKQFFTLCRQTGKRLTRIETTFWALSLCGFRWRARSESNATAGCHENSFINGSCTVPSTSKVYLHHKKSEGRLRKGETAEFFGFWVYKNLQKSVKSIKIHRNPKIHQWFLTLSWQISSWNCCQI